MISKIQGPDVNSMTSQSYEVFWRVRKQL